MKKKVLKLITATALSISMIFSSMAYAKTDVSTIKSSLNLFYSFDDGKALDESGKNNNGTLSGTVLPSGVASVNQNGLGLSGDGYVEIPDSSSLNFGTSDFSISFWIKTTNSNETIFDKRGSNGAGYLEAGYHSVVYNGVPLIQINDPQKGFYNYWSTSTKRIDDGVWHFVAFSIDRDSTTGVKTFIDGVLQGEYNATYRTGNITNTGKLLIGKHKDGTVNFNGALDEFMIFGKALTTAEVTSLFALTKIPAVTVSKDFSFSNGKSVSLGDTESQVVSMFGTPARKDNSEYGFLWYIYNQDYSNYLQIGIKNGVVIAIHSNAKNMKFKNSLVVGTAKNTASDFMTTNKYSVQSAGNANYYYSAANTVTIYFDIYKNASINTVSSITINSSYGQSSQYTLANLQDSFEKEVFDLANAFRVREGKSVLTWCTMAATSARKHSVDMATKNFFSHTNLDGLDPFIRMKNEGIVYQTAGENIAAGHSNAIGAHEAWVNSPGHRANILGNFTKLGVGFGYNAASDYSTYYTQNFYTPM